MLKSRVERLPDGSELCTIEHEGREFSALGSVVTPDRATAYVAKDFRHVTDWSGNVIGTCVVVSSWRTPRSCDRMYQIRATIGGRTYTGRSAGAGMLWRGKVVA